MVKPINRYIDLALEKAKINIGSTKTNPSVGCVVERNNTILSSGSTSIGGRPHAEYNALNKQEREAIGNHTFHKQTADPLGKSAEVRENRVIFISWCLEHNQKVANTLFEKTDCKLVTYRAVGTKINEPLNRPAYEQLDFVTVPHRWKNSIKDCESDSAANI